MTTRMSPLLAFPKWVAAVCLPVALFGVGSWNKSIGNRVALVVGAYMAVFSVVGLPIDLFWGAITNPLLAFGLIWFVPGLRDLLRSLRRVTERGTAATSVSD